MGEQLFRASLFSHLLNTMRAEVVTGFKIDVCATEKEHICMHRNTRPCKNIILPDAASSNSLF